MIIDEIDINATKRGVKMGNALALKDIQKAIKIFNGGAWINEPFVLKSHTESEWIDVPIYEECGECGEEHIVGYKKELFTRIIVDESIDRLVWKQIDGWNPDKLIVTEEELKEVG